jgi:uncharacterized protein (TIGR03435 family)
MKWIIALTGWALWGQPTSTPVFEVASIRPVPFNGQGVVGIGFTGNRLLAHHVSLGQLVVFAYGVDGFQVSGGARWVHSTDLYGPDVYDVTAKAEGEAVPTEDQFRQMLQALLADRFQLRIHREAREMPVYELAIAQNGPKLRAASRDPGAQTVWTSGVVNSLYAAKKTSMKTLAWMLQSQVGRPVVDKTGLSGSYDFELQYAPGNPPPADATAPSIFTAVQEELGLKLESGRASFPVMVIDGAERPSGN